MANLHGTISSAATISGQVGVIAIDGYTIVLSKPTSTTYKMTCTKGTTVKTLTWKDGAKGDTGKGISSAVLNNDYTLTITYTDGTSYTTPSIRGAAGSDASVTAENIATALGYTPANQTALAGKQDVIEDLETIRSKANSALQQHQDISGKQDVISDLATIRSKANSALQTETDPTVPSWAKADSKPSYSASEIAYGDTTVGAALTEQNEDIVQKLSEPSSGLAVGKYFRVASIDASGHAVLEACDLPLDDYVTYTDYATTSRGGVFKPSSWYDTQVQNGTLFGVERTAENYMNFSNHSRLGFVSNGTLNNVLATPSIMPTLTASEQASARARIGAVNSSQFELLTEITATEDTNLYINKDSNNNPLSITKALVIATCPLFQQASSGLVVKAYRDTDKELLGLGYINTSTAVNAVKRGHCLIECTNGLWLTNQGAFSTTGIVTLQTYERYTDVYTGTISQIDVYGIIAGYTVKVYGVRA